jgi:sulfatase modifying factor 1
MRILFFFILLSISMSEIKCQDKAKIEKLLDFVKVEGGTFIMGDTSRIDAEPHEVKLSSFYIQRTEVTQELWEAVMGTNPSEDKTSVENPVTHISWEDCQKFIQKLNKITGKKYSLPTEAQWEYAARGGNLSKGYKYSGSDDIFEVAWFSYILKQNDSGELITIEGNSEDKLHPVKKKKPNELGVYDMSGNVWEYCLDWYGDYIVSEKEKNNPKGIKSGTTKVLRGGGWSNNADASLITTRLDWDPKESHLHFGFRLVLN